MVVLIRPIAIQEELPTGIEAGFQAGEGGCGRPHWGELISAEVLPADFRGTLKSQGHIRKISDVKRWNYEM